MRRFRVLKAMTWGGAPRHPGDVVEEIPGRGYPGLLERGELEELFVPVGVLPSVVAVKDEAPPAPAAEPLQAEPDTAAPKKRGRPPKQKPTVES